MYKMGPWWHQLYLWSVNNCELGTGRRTPWHASLTIQYHPAACCCRRLDLSHTKWPSRKVTLWQDDTYDINLPGCQSIEPVCTALNLPKLFHSVSEADKSCYCIKVFRLAADNGMKDICGTVASLVKSIPLGDSWPTMIICNHLLFGFVDWNVATVTLIEKRALADAAVAEPDRRQIDHLGWSSCDMNSTSLVFTRDQRFVLKKDFWNPTKNTL